MVFSSNKAVAYMLYDVFISYSRKDATSVNLIYNALKQANLTVWLDRGKITYGSVDWRADIEQALNNSACILYIASPNSYDSENVREELVFSDTLRMKSFVAMVAETRSLPYGFNRAHRANLHKDMDGKELNDLIEAIKNHAATAKKPPVSKSIGRLLGLTNPFVRAEERDQQPLDFANTLFLVATLEAAAELLPIKKYKGRAALYWVDESSQELYVVAATEHFEEAELRTRLKLKEGFAGISWAKRETEFRDPKSVSEHTMRVQWNFNEEQIALTQRLGIVVTIPIYRPGGRIAGVLSLDSTDELSEREINIPEFEDEANEISNFLLRTIEYAKPISARNYRNLSSIIHSARLLAPMHIKVRAAIFLVDSVRQELFMVAGSDDFAKIWVNDLRFKKGQGLVGTVWETGKKLEDNRDASDPPQLRRYLRERWHMNDKQIKISIRTQSIVCVPIWADNQKSSVIGVLLVDSLAASSDSNLHRGSTITLVMMQCLAHVASKVIQYDRSLGART